MFTLLGLDWPHLVEKKQSKTSLISTTHSRSSSVPEQASYIEARSLRVSTFDGPVRSVSIVRRQAASLDIPCCAEFESSSRSSQSSKQSDTMPGPSACPEITAAEGNALHGRYAGLPTPPDGFGEDIGMDLNPHVPPDPLKIDSSVCGCDEEQHDDIHPLPDSPLGIAKFGFISRESFDTSVKGLVQEEPDLPIGGYRSAPMTNEKVSGTSNIGHESLDGTPHSDLILPQIALTSPPLSQINKEPSTRRALIPRFHLSEPFMSAVRKGKQVQRADVSNLGAGEIFYTTAMVTARSTPVPRGNTDMSHDGARASNPDINNENSSNLTLLDGCSPTDHPELEDIEVYNLNNTPLDDTNSKVRQAVVGTSMSGDLPSTAYGLSGNVPVASVGMATADSTTPQAALAEHPSMNGLPNSTPKNLDGLLPIDATGILPAPAMPKKNTKRKKIVNVGKSGIRKARRVLIRKPFLVILLGRQLAGPTKDALNLISRGIPVELDVEGLAEAAEIPPPPLKVISPSPAGPPFRAPT